MKSVKRLPRPEPSRSIEWIQVEMDQPEERNGEVIVETPVSLTINSELWLTLMCTPVDLEALAVGFLYNEGVIQSKDEVADVRVCPTGDNVDVWLAHTVERPDRWRRTSGCTGGVTSVEASNAADDDTAYLGAYTHDSAAGEALNIQQVAGLIEALSEAQDLYRLSGGVHTSAVSDGRQLLLTCEDIGRHNTLDKLAGRILLERLQPTPWVLLTTGRISSEMMQKAARLGARVVISRTSPSSLSIDLAQRWGITLIGYARRHRFNIYTHPERIAGV